MNKKREFNYNGKPCAIVYNDKKFYIAVYKDEKRLITEKLEYLFPVPRFSKGQELIAYHVANLHVLPNLLVINIR